VASRFASLLHGEILSNGVPACVAVADVGVLETAALVEVAKLPIPTWGDS